MDQVLKKHAIEYLNKGLRFDGRKPTELRNISIETGISKSAEGSARVVIGSTEVLAGVKLSVEKPYPDTPDQGNLMVGAELLPLSSPEFESGPPGEQSVELARVTDRGIRESKAIDAKKLCIEKSEKVWAVVADIVTINDRGNLMDASALATMAALIDTRFPEYDGTSINYKSRTDKKLPLVRHPISVTVYKIGEHLIVDPTDEEEKIYDARLTVASTADGNLCALQKGGEAALSSEEVLKMVDIALEKAAELRKLLDALFR